MLDGAILMSPAVQRIRVANPTLHAPTFRTIVVPAINGIAYRFYASACCLVELI